MNSKRDSEIAIGEDSFLDTIANLVGILIIFVVIAGTGTQTSALNLARSEQEARDKSNEAVISKLNDLEKDIGKQIERLQAYAVELEMRRHERDGLLDRIHQLRYDIERKAQSMEDDQRIRSEQLAQLAQLQAEIDRRCQELEEIQVEDPAPMVLQHLPTPMAKTVFTKEMHIMIRHQRVALIPWDELIDELKKEAEQTARRGLRKSEFEGTLGPMFGFMMLYRFTSKRGVVSNGSSVTTGQMIELDRFELEPQKDLVLESIDQAMSDGGRLRVALSARRAEETVITAWVYEDSFETFRQLKEALFAKGFLAAARPLPMAARIAASPHGSHSLAQ